MKIVRNILEDVKKEGDKAVIDYTLKFDNIKIKKIELTKEDIEEAYNKVDKETINALKTAAKNIKAFAKKQMAQFKDFETTKEGITTGQRVSPIEKVGCYVPGGRYPLPSTALMTVIPAKVAGVKDVVVCSPKIQPVTVVAADIAGANRIFCIGGIQAIGAMAYGTKSVPKVDKIVGPGNKYVAAAKKEVYGDVGIDFIAGPSEILIIADERANPEYIAADLLAQAEHDADAKANLLTTSKKLAEKVKKEIKKQLNTLKTKEIAKESISNSQISIVKNINEAIKIANEMAPEHLELQVKNSEEIIPKLKNFGSLFIGEYSAEVFGDYCAGSNHTLPTNKAARYTGGLSVKDFIRLQTYQKVSKQGAKILSATASKLAEVEGLDAHRKAVEVRKEEK